MNTLSTRQLALLFSLLAVVYLIGLFVPVIMDIDASQYASISWEMLQRKSFLMVMHRDANYLDKPPLLFWLSAAAMKLLGPEQWVYRLPSFLSTILGAYAAYRLARELYSPRAGQLAALLWFSNQAFFLVNHDVRTDTLLANFTALAVWQLHSYSLRGRYLSLLLAFAAIGMGMLAKGPIGLVAPAMAFGPYWLWRRNWAAIFKWQWILGLVIVALFLAPMTWGLYEQFGSYGPRFFYWKQSFGRITGESEWRSDSDPFFFWHTFLWSYAPWMLFSAWALGKKLLSWLRGTLPPRAELFSLSGFLLVMLAMSMSHYKLPHYIYVGWIFVTLFTAEEMDSIFIRYGRRARWFFGLQSVVAMLIWVLVGLFVFVLFPLQNLWLLAALAALLLAGAYFSVRPSSVFQRLWMPSFLSILAFNLLMNAHVYPALGKYQSGSEAAAYIRQHRLPTDELYQYGVYQHSFEFYLGQLAKSLEIDELSHMVRKKTIWVLVHQPDLEHIQKLGLRYRTEQSFDDFHITTLTLDFLRPSTRASTLTKAYLIEIPMQP